MNPNCMRCKEVVYRDDDVPFCNKHWHKKCFRCTHCNANLGLKTCKTFNNQPYCSQKCFFSLRKKIVPENVPLKDMIPFPHPESSAKKCGSELMDGRKDFYNDRVSLDINPHDSLSGETSSSDFQDLSQGTGQKIIQQKKQQVAMKSNSKDPEMFLKFRDQKIELNSNIGQLIDSVRKLEQRREDFSIDKALGKLVFDRFFEYDFQAVIEKLDTNLQMIKRTNIKCVFVGSTSNGKSATINALLSKKVLPSSMGSTTCCFLCISGCDDSEGYVLDEDEKRRDLQYALKANETTIHKMNVNTMLKIFYPISKCQLLENNVEIIDSPGLNDIANHDAWIERYCADADVFVLILDCNSTLSKTEGEFLKKVEEKFSKPNVIVLVNKWDMTQSLVEEEKKNLRRQYEKKVNEFLTKVSSSENLFFVSSLKALEGKRDDEFQKFKQYLSETISPKGFKMKVTKHVATIKEAMNQMRDLMNNDNITTNCFPSEQLHKLVEDHCGAFILKIKNHDSILNSKKHLSQSFIEVEVATKEITSAVCNGFYDRFVDDLIEEAKKLIDGNGGVIGAFLIKEIDFDPLKRLDRSQISLQPKIEKVERDRRKEVKHFIKNITNWESDSIFFVSSKWGLKRKDKCFHAFQQRLLSATNGVNDYRFKTVKEALSSLNIPDLITQRIKNLSDEERKQFKELFSKHLPISTVQQKLKKEFPNLVNDLKKRSCGVTSLWTTEEVIKEYTCKIHKKFPIIFDPETTAIVADAEKLFDQHCGVKGCCPLKRIDLDGISFNNWFETFFKNKSKQLKRQYKKDVNDFLGSSSNSNSNSFFFVSAALGQKKEDRNFHNFEQCFLREITENKFIIKVSCRADMTMDEISSLNKIQYNHDVPVDISKSEIEDLLKKVFQQKVVSSIRANVEDNSKFILSNVEKSGSNYEGIDSDTKERIKKVLPNEISNIFNSEIENLRRSVKDVYLRKLSNPSIDSEIQVYVEPESFWAKVKTDFGGEIQRKCSNINTAMETLNTEGSLKRNFLWGTWFLRKHTGLKTEYDTNYEELLQKMSLCFSQELVEQIPNVVKIITERLGKSRERFNVHLEDMRKIKSNLGHERTNWERTKDELQSEFKKKTKI